MNNKLNNSDLSTLRRWWILSQIVKNGLVTRKDIAKKYPDLKSGSIKNDLIAIQKGLDIDIKQDHIIGSKKEVYYYREDTGNTSSQRIAKSMIAKHQIAEEAFDFIKGFNALEVNTRLRETLQILTSNAEQTKAEYIKRMSELESDFIPADVSFLNSKHTSLIDKLHAYSRQRTRSIVLDAGTTTLRVARLIGDLTIPDSDLDLDFLNVTTNYEPIFRLLSKKHVNAKVRVIGGTQVEGTDVIAGYESSHFLQSLDFDFNMAIVGCSHICSDKLVAYSLGYDQAQLKSEFLQTSKISILVADDSKFLNENESPEGTGCCKLRDFDLVITNKPVLAEKKQKRNGIDQHWNFKESVYKLRSRGIPVLVVDSKNDFAK